MDWQAESHCSICPKSYFVELTIQMRVLIVADNASNQFGGEAFLPFNYFRLLRARNIDARLLVHERNKGVLTKEFARDLDRLHYVKDTLLHKIVFKIGCFLPRRVADVTTGFVIYVTTQIAQRSLVKKLSESYHFDLVHVPVPVSPKAPSLLHGFGLPVIFGPMNGGMEYPPAFRSREGLLSHVAIGLGRGVASFLNFVFPGKRHARLLLVANERTRKALPRGVSGQVIELVENGVDFAVWRRSGCTVRTGQNLKLIFVGRLIDWKALEIVFEAIQRLGGDPALSFQIIGDGPMRQNWEKLSHGMELINIVTFSGWMDQVACARALEAADALVLPSLFESGGAVVLEAMAMGLPVVATAWGGPLDYIDDTCGVLVRPDSREGLVSGFASAIRRLAHSPELRRRLGEAGYLRARQIFDWDKKIDRILELYALAVKPA
jgi:glycosyltransferase involved in cell wall biosynthesis